MARIAEESVRRVREANDIVSVVESYNLQFKRSGANFLALCPFHNEKTPSFNINPQRQIFKCFGCDAKGDVFKFVQLMERLSYPEAIEALAERSGIELEYEGGRRDAGEPEKPSENRKALLWANSRALAYFETCLDDAGGQQARDYLESRGFAKEILRDWRLGWAPDEWNGLLERLVAEAGEHKREQVVEVALAAGLLRQNEEGNIYDAFRGRVMFPIFNNQHQPVGFGGRVLEEKPRGGAKYVNSAEGRLFHKRELLYGLNFAAKEIGRIHTALVVEGYTDTILCHQHGIRNAVATLGTSLTGDHIRTLRRYVQHDGHVVALFDADEAGERATRRAIELFMEEDVALRVVRGLAVKDAGEFLPAYGAEAFRAELDKAEDAFRYVLRGAFADSERMGVDARAAAVRNVMAVVNRCPNDVKVAMMRREVAAAAGVPEETLPRRETKAGGPPERRGLQPEERSPPLPARREESGWRTKGERRLVAFALENADWARAIDELPEETIRDELAQLCLNAVRKVWGAGATPTPEEALAGIDHPEAGAFYAEMSELAEAESPLRDIELRELLARLKAEDLREESQRLQNRINRGDLPPEEVSALLARKLEIQRALHRRDAG